RLWWPDPDCTKMVLGTETQWTPRNTTLPAAFAVACESPRLDYLAFQRVRLVLDFFTWILQPTWAGRHPAPVPLICGWPWCCSNSAGRTAPKQSSRFSTTCFAIPTSLTFPS